MNQKVFKEIFQQKFSFLCHYAENMIKDKFAAEDLVEDVFIRFWEKRETIQINTNLNSYILRSVHNQCIDYLRKKTDKLEYQIEKFTDLNLLNLTTSYNSLSNTIEITELNSDIDSAIACLPEGCKKIFRMSRFDDLTYKEIAFRLNISVNTVEMQMSRALKKLRISLKEHLQILFSL